MTIAENMKTRWCSLNVVRIVIFSFSQYLKTWGHILAPNFGLSLLTPIDAIEFMENKYLVSTYVA